jgi:hypothetical protein
MRSDTAVSSNDADAGFLTPVFGVAAVALGLIALAGLQLARGDQGAERRRLERLQEHYRADGAAVRGAWRILHTEDAEALKWREDVAGQSFTVLAEPEMLKLSLAEANGARGRARLQAFLGDAEGARLADAVHGLATRAEPPSREQVVALGEASATWRACGLTLVSAFSRLTDNVIGPAHIPSPQSYRPRAGEVWRLVVASDRRIVVDRLVRFTGDLRDPLAILDEGDVAAGPGLEVLNCSERLKAS